MAPHPAFSHLLPQEKGSSGRLVLIRSPFDIPGINTKAPTDDILQAVKESRSRWNIAVFFHRFQTRCLLWNCAPQNPAGLLPPSVRDALPDEQSDKGLRATSNNIRQCLRYTFSS